MKIVIVYGSPRKGCSYTAAQIFKDEMTRHGDIEFTELFLPKDMPEFCLGCNTCFTYGEEKCPHAKYTLPVIDAMLRADALMFTSPSYVLQASGSMKNFLDHFGHMFMVHRPKAEMFHKKAFIISTAAGAGMRAAIKTIRTSHKFWGVNRIYSAGFALQESDWQRMEEKRRISFESKLKKKARRFYREVASGKKHAPYLFTRILFSVSRIMVKKYSPKDNPSLDNIYWEKMGWLNGKKPF